MFKSISKVGFGAVILMMLNGCLGMPKGVEPVTGFELNRYLGTWYEIARLDHSFEDGLSQVSAEYSINEDGSVKVINRGFSDQDQQWSEALGKAKFVDGSDEGYLKVSFFGPFYGSYVVFELDKENYQYAFVSGPDLDYLWLLSRTKKVDQEVIERFVSTAQSLGFKTNELIFVEQK
ncbi:MULTISPECIES: lipocalin family protein [Aliivibrio]|uniref:Outer membrane lipoprotein Blc n=2 Tax=Aliivibrio fischeri TaxID=668 RepID=A0A6N3YZY4_ALIFS|nr:MULTISPECIES: lipocalin family protein [Aliivibrio]MBD1569437.1 lipocalin [Aliivibrio sp. S10_S31]MCE4935343.1 lipocalin family protein [Aliivibrio fischeri]MCE7536088.1 lipocalin family protein [Aliivibrio fischeri]MCE7555094.1 lipocalin family protein [Aliivibrio fischeri]MCE7558874.1 lipocalin family protein [Aliivibrio fischeri]